VGKQNHVATNGDTARWESVRHAKPASLVVGGATFQVAVPAFLPA